MRNEDVLRFIWDRAIEHAKLAETSRAHWLKLQDVRKENESLKSGLTEARNMLKEKAKP